MKGKVVKYKQDKGYGFICGDDGHDYFFHKSEVPNGYRSTLKQGQNVEFKSSSNDRGLLALRIKPHEFINFSTEKQSRRLKKNPFTPQDPVYDPHKFAGRSESVANAVDSLYNGKNVLVSGHRGVGKSSLSIQLLNVLKGNPLLLNKLNIETDGFKFKYLTSDHRCLSSNEIEEIASSLVNGLVSSLGKDEAVKSKTSEWQLSLKFLKYKRQTAKEPLTYSDLSSQFASDLKTIRNEALQNCFNGLCMLIDEVDVLEDRVQIAPFLKATIEKLRQDGICDVCFLVAGVVGIATRLISEHKSSMRLF
ncbi:cold shock domain-containing protein [Pseudoalteromonas luteoviolacea]|uniref:CSD domain-containing protein n=1 Tax=Pseudoalteromonas luteoviolacea DSM 6061 TaxID=1365250 RepID=A0A161XYC9_9GAMM|nr:cold shock domain-containing protein [Pseudoalteromonas luteoviolacea]KZN39848.1 hypothetical protein N475_13910 [Pseudoalteromonas luteoviolacea DSM 6061]MBE0385788.1 hypothetical protein [Pseudoalteromonas luteoviolacea DSM 6061]